MWLQNTNTYTIITAGMMQDHHHNRMQDMYMANIVCILQHSTFKYSTLQTVFTLNNPHNMLQRHTCCVYVCMYVCMYCTYVLTRIFTVFCCVSHNKLLKFQIHTYVHIKYISTRHTCSLYLKCSRCYLIVG